MWIRSILFYGLTFFNTLVYSPLVRWIDHPRGWFLLSNKALTSPRCIILLTSTLLCHIWDANGHNCLCCGSSYWMKQGISSGLPLFDGAVLEFFNQNVLIQPNTKFEYIYIYIDGLRNGKFCHRYIFQCVNLSHLFWKSYLLAYYVFFINHLALPYLLFVYIYIYCSKNSLFDMCWSTLKHIQTHFGSGSVVKLWLSL